MFDNIHPVSLGARIYIGRFPDILVCVTGFSIVVLVVGGSTSSTSSRSSSSSSSSSDSSYQK